MTKYPKGSMGAADEKMKRWFKICMTLATIIAIVILWTVPNMKEAAAQTGAGYKTISWILFGVCFAVIFFEELITDATSSEVLFYVLWFVSFGGAFFLRICGGV